MLAFSTVLNYNSGARVGTKMGTGTISARLEWETGVGDWSGVKGTGGTQIERTYAYHDEWGLERD